MWCDLGKPGTCPKGWNCEIKEIKGTKSAFFGGKRIHSMWYQKGSIGVPGYNHESQYACRIVSNRYQ